MMFGRLLGGLFLPAPAWSMLRKAHRERVSCALAPARGERPKVPRATADAGASSEGVHDMTTPDVDWVPNLN